MESWIDELDQEYGSEMSKDDSSSWTLKNDQFSVFFLYLLMAGVITVLVLDVMNIVGQDTQVNEIKNEISVVEVQDGDDVVKEVTVETSLNVTENVTVNQTLTVGQTIEASEVNITDKLTVDPAASRVKNRQEGKIDIANASLTVVGGAVIDELAVTDLETINEATNILVAGENNQVFQLDHPINSEGHFLVLDSLGRASYAAFDKEAQDLHLVKNVLNNFDATAAPTINDDSSAGFAKGSEVIFGGDLYYCRDATVGAADWQNISAAVGGGVTNVASGTGLTGGPITTTGTLSLDIDSLTAVSGITGSDTLPFHDDGVGVRKVTVSDLAANLFDQKLDSSENVSFAQVSLPSQGEVRLENTGDSNYVGLRAPGTVGTSYTLTLPDSVAAAGQFLQASDTSGTLAWVSAANPFDQSLNTSDSVSFAQLDLEAGGELRLQNAGDTDYVGFKAPTTVGTSYTLTLPDNVAAAGQFLQASDTSGTLAWVSAANPFDQSLNTSDSVSFAQLDLEAGGELRLQNAGDTDYVGFKAPTTVGTSYTLTLPDNVAAAGQFLQASDTSGTLAWVSAPNPFDQTLNTSDNVSFAQLDLEAGGELRLQNAGDTDYVGFKAPTTVGTSYTLTLPDGVASTGEVLQASDASGTLAWVSAPNPFDQTLNTSDNVSFAQLDLEAGGELRLQNAGDTDYVGFKAPTTVGTSYTLTLPDGVAATGEVLQASDASGTLAWVSAPNPFDQTLNTSDNVSFAQLDLEAGGELRLQNAGDTDYVGFKAPTTVGTSYTLTLPDGVAATGEVLQASDASGTLAWVSAPNPFDQSLNTSDSVSFAQLDLEAGGELRLQNAGDTDYVGFKAPTTVGTSYTLTLPDGVAATGEVLQASDASGTLAWVSAPNPFDQTLNTSDSVSFAQLDLEAGGELRLQNAGDTDYVGFKAPTTVGTSYTLTLPDGVAATGEVLQASDASGTLAWVSAPNPFDQSLNTSDSVSFAQLDLEAGGELRLQNAGDTDYVGFKAPTTVGTSYTLTLPDGVAATGEVLQASDASGTLAWVSAPNPFDQSLNTSDSVSFAQLDLEAGGELRLQNAGDTDYVGFKAPTTVGTSYTLTLPDGVAATGEVLQASDASGTLAWVSAPNPFDQSLNTSDSVSFAQLDLEAGGELRLQNAGDTDYVGFKAPTTVGTSYTLTLPDGVAATGEVLQASDASGTLAWVSAPNPFDQSLNTSDSVSFAQLDLEAGGELRLQNAGDTDYVGFKAPTTVGTSYTLTLPDGVAATGEVLQASDASGTLAWVSAPNPFDQSLNTSDSVSFAQLDLEAGGELRLQNAGDTDYVGFKAPTTVGTSYTLTLPENVAATGQVLRASDTSGTLAWTEASEPSVQTIADDDAATIDWDLTVGRTGLLVLDDNTVSGATRELDLADETKIVDGEIYTLILRQDSSGNTDQVITFTADFVFDGTPTMPSGTDAQLILTFIGRNNGGDVALHELVPHRDGKYTTQQNFVQVDLTDAATITWDLETQQTAELTLTDLSGDTRDIKFTNPRAGGTYVLKIIQVDDDQVVEFVINGSNDFFWPSGVAPTITTGAGKIDILTFYSDGTHLYGVASQDFQT